MIVDNDNATDKNDDNDTVKATKTAAKKPLLKNLKANVRVVPAQVSRYHLLQRNAGPLLYRLQIRFCFKWGGRGRIDSRRRKLLLSNSVESSIWNRRLPFGTSVTDS